MHTFLIALAGFFVLAAVIYLVFGLPMQLLHKRKDRVIARREFGKMQHTTTVGQERTRIAVEKAFGNVLQNQQLAPPVQQNQQPAAPARSLSTRLAQLDEAMQAGLITQQDYAKKRAEIIDSA